MPVPVTPQYQSVHIKSIKLRGALGACNLLAIDIKLRQLTPFMALFAFFHLSLRFFSLFNRLKYNGKAHQAEVTFEKKNTPLFLLEVALS